MIHVQEGDYEQVFEQSDTHVLVLVPVEKTSKGIPPDSWCCYDGLISVNRHTRKQNDRVRKLQIGDNIRLDRFKGNVDRIDGDYVMLTLWTDHVVSAGRLTLHKKDVSII